MNTDMFFEKQALQTEPMDLFGELSEADKIEGHLAVSIASAIFRNRKAKGFSQADLANRMGITQPMISQWESGECNISIESIAKIADALNLDVSIVFSDANKKPNSAKVMMLSDARRMRTETFKTKYEDVIFDVQEG